MQTIVYPNDSAFYAGVAALVARGLTFKAHYNTLTIELTGGC